MIFSLDNNSTCSCSWPENLYIQGISAPLLCVGTFQRMNFIFRYEPYTQGLDLPAFLTTGISFPSEVSQKMTLSSDDSSVLSCMS